MTLTTRLSLFFQTTLAIVLVGFSVTLYLLVRSYLHRQSEERLDAALNALVAAVEFGPDGFLEWEPTQRHLKLGPATFGEQVLWLVSDEQGAIVDRSKHANAEEFLAEASDLLRASQRSTKRLEWQGERWQFGHCWVHPSNKETSANHDSKKTPLGTHEKKYPALSIIAGVPIDPMQTTLRHLAGTLVGLSLVIWLLSWFAGRAVCRRALRPVSLMAASAGEIDANNLEQRLAAVSSKDELEDLNHAINHLLDRLQDSFERQRRFTSEASHQLRTPLAAILGQVEVALRRQRAPDEYERILTTVQQKGEHLRRIIEALLFLARADNEARLDGLVHVDLTHWLSEYLEGWSQHERAHDIVFESKSKAACVTAVQPALLGELLNILMDNACKYSAPGTPILLRLERDDQFINVQVEDRGHGIAESDLVQLFTPFFRSAETLRLGIDGIGLGLSIARRLAGIFGGAITVKSQIGAGSCFTLRLPTLATPTTTPSAAPKASTSR